MTTQQKAAPGWTPESGCKTSDACNSNPQRYEGLENLDVVVAQMGLVQSLLAEASGLSLDEKDIYGLYTLMGDWRCRIEAVASPESEGVGP